MIIMITAYAVHASLARYPCGQWPEGRALIENFNSAEQGTSQAHKLTSRMPTEQSIASIHAMALEKCLM